MIEADDSVSSSQGLKPSRELSNHFNDHRLETIYA